MLIGTYTAGPLPKFVGLSDGLAARVAEARTATASPPPPPAGGNGPIRVPPLNPDDINKFASLFEKSDVQNGLLSGKRQTGALFSFTVD